MIDGFYPVKEIKFDDGSVNYIPQHFMKDYNIRVIRSGNVIELYQYDNKVFYNYNDKERLPREKKKQMIGMVNLTIV